MQSTINSISNDDHFDYYENEHLPYYTIELHNKTIDDSIDIYPYIFPTKVKKDLKKNRLLLVGIVILFISISISIYYYAIILLPKSQVVTSGIDKFGVKEIYSTKGGGREWFLNMENPKKDPLFSITDDIPITKQNDDSSWFINNSNTRMNVNTPTWGYTMEEYRDDRIC